MRTLLVATIAATGICLASTANVSALPISGSAVRDAVNETSAVSNAYYYYHRYHHYYRPYYGYHSYYRYHRHWY
jgi:hypothetical protein